MPKIAICGEAWGEQEARERTPFVGAMSSQLRPMLHEAGIHPADCFMTNVFNIRYDGKMEQFCGPKAEAIKGYGPLIKGRYCRAEFKTELDRLAEELCEANPNVIIAMGNTPVWALFGKTGISKLRGTTAYSTHCVRGFKVLPTYHPAAIIHQWELRPTTIVDLQKAAREAEYPEIRRPQREIWIEPTLDDVRRFINDFVSKDHLLSVDIETAGTQITCIGFSPRPDLGLVVPFLDTRRKNRSYWQLLADEQSVWHLIKGVLIDPQIRKLFQNGLYDISFLYRAYGIAVAGAEHDTMLLHHALLPESLKGLGYLGSLYTDEGAWKHMRSRHETIKRDD
jgi:DNA polymerase